MGPHGHAKRDGRKKKLGRADQFFWVSTEGVILPKTKGNVRIYQRIPTCQNIGECMFPRRPWP
jgi:hypothetical protein